MTTRTRAATPFDLAKEELESMQEAIAAMNGQSDLSAGEVIDARVIDVDDREVFLDIGRKQDGRCARSEFAEAPSAGDIIPVVVIHSGDDGPVRLSRKEAERRIAWRNILEAFNADASLNGVVEKLLNHGYIIDYGGVQLFMPLSQSDLKTRKGRLQIGSAIDFKILEVKDRHRSAVVSHRRIIEERNDERWNELVAKYKEGDEAEGVITKKVSFGLFVEVCGVEGLLHQSDISWKKWAPFKSRFKVKDPIVVKILAMDRESNRLSLGLKQLTEDPWQWASRELRPDAIIAGRVTSVTDYGAFVEIAEGLEGLIHVSELTWSKRPKHPKKYVEPEQTIDVQVLGVDPENKRISLGRKQLLPDPWNDLVASVRVGDVLEGRVSSVTKFGAFVEVKDDIEGLIHFKDYSWAEHPDRKMLKKGDLVKFKILEINSHERRIACGVKQLEPSPYQTLQGKYRKGDVIEGKVARVAPFGLFVDIGDGFEGLVHISRLPLEPDQKLEDAYKPGQEVTTILQGIDVDNRRIALSIKAYQQRQERALMDQYMRRDAGPSTSSLGAFFKKDRE